MPFHVAMPARLTPDDVDPRVAGANRIFDDVARLVGATGLVVTVVDDLAIDLDAFEGIVLPGGGDVDPVRYGGEQTSALYDVNPEQDELDFGIAARARAEGLPILGVCRGLQVLNVAYGGTLIPDLPASSVVHTHSDESSTELVWAWHEIDLAPGSRLAAAHPGDVTRIASAHHQGIGRLGAGLTAVARADDGLVEGIEHEHDGVIAVQWHPEADGVPEAEASAPFRAFATLVAERAAARGRSVRS